MREFGPYYIDIYIYIPFKGLYRVPPSLILRTSRCSMCFLAKEGADADRDSEDQDEHGSVIEEAGWYAAYGRCTQMRYPR